MIALYVLRNILLFLLDGSCEEKQSNKQRSTTYDYMQHGTQIGAISTNEFTA
jgi:hypothetical protein